MIKKLQQILVGSLHRQMVAGMTITVILVMGLFIWNTTQHQQTIKIQQYKEQAIALADTLSSSSAILISSRDFDGLQEIVSALSHYPDLKHAIVIGLQGQVLAHTDPSQVGAHIKTLPNDIETQHVKYSKNSIEFAKAIILVERKVGWVIIDLTKKTYLEEIMQIKIYSFFYVLAAIFFGVLITTLASRYLTRRLHIIQKVADKVQTGSTHLRVNMQGDDEAASLAKHFDKMLDSLALREAQLASFYSLDLVGLTVTSADKGWVSINSCLCTMLEYTEEQLKALTWVDLTHPDDLAADLEQFTKLLANEIDGYSLEKRFISRTGKVISTMLVVRCVRKTNGNVDYVMAMVQDISKQKEDAIQIERLAYFDPLTKLPNRRLLDDRLKQALILSERSNHYGALLFLDLDNFKTLNDTLGHDIGDMLLQQVANRLITIMRKGDTVSRFGGDEFVILLESLHINAVMAATEVKAIAANILNSINQSYNIAGHSYSTSTSIGAALFLGHKTTSDELLKQADISMYQAKKSGRNAFCFFDPQMESILINRVELERDLLFALEHNQFQLYYQVQVDSSNTPIGVEALIRWINPKRGIVSPLDFIPLAEDTGIILNIGQWVLESACIQLKAWQENNSTAGLSLSINVSARQFHQADFVEIIKNSIDKYSINPSLLKIELTESILLNNIETIIHKMNTLATMGIQFSLDDFGTGYSSLQYLKTLPLHQLKIDQSFVRDLGVDTNDKTIVKTIISMAHSLGLNVIAEGVETVPQQQYLVSQGCTHFQGYLFSRPVPITQFDILFTQATKY
ncbi:EAL domain-containing protein [Shewanella sp. HL-SH5]|uniref:EAL domain-containing protein n=1 Tax=Shewanella sp. HL-SH5 TaxID=3436241 RepID=UPI003EBFCD7D